MIWAVVKTKLLVLVRDPVSLMLVGLLPIVFYAIFAGIFGGMEGGPAGGMTTIVVDLDGTAPSRRITAALENAGSGLRLSMSRDQAGKETPWTADTARAAVRQGDAPAAIIIPKGVGVSFGPSRGPPVIVYVDPSNPIAGTMIPGLLQQAAMVGLQADMMRTGIAQLEQIGWELTPKQRDILKTATAAIEAEPAPDAGGADNSMLLPVRVEDVADQDAGPPRSMATYYLAAIGVMFLLFSVAGASGTLLEDQEAGILDRLLFTPLGMTRLLLAHWTWMTVMAMCSMTILFVFATLVFGVGPWTWQRLVASVAVTLATAAAASGLGLLLATACKSRAQLAGVSTILILAMSAVGGSMIPRFAMPEAVREIGWYTTFNAWAVEGYLAVFWYTPVDASLATLMSGAAPALIVLAAIACVMFFAANVLARRWERT